MADRVDLNGMLSQIKSTLEAANATSTASPIYLSQDMSKTVQKVLRRHPNKIPVQASHFPYVTCFVTKKAQETATIAKDQLSGKRTAIVSIDVVGAVWNDRFSNVAEDPADNDIHYLMENVELALRSDPTLGGRALWQKAEDVEYYDKSLDERVHLRAGILRLSAKVHY